MGIKKLAGIGGRIAAVLVFGALGLNSCQGQSKEGGNTGATSIPEGASPTAIMSTETPRPTATKLPFLLVTVQAPKIFPGANNVRKFGDGSECGFGFPPDPLKRTDMRNPKAIIDYICVNGKWVRY